MTDKIMAIVAMLTLVAFLAVVAVFVPDIDLILVIVFVCGLAIYDFWKTFKTRQHNAQNNARNPQ